MEQSAQFADEFRDSVGFGWAASVPAHDWSALVAHKNKEIVRLNTTYGNVLKDAGVEYVEGFGRVVDPTTVEITMADGSTKKLKTKNILVATGGSPTKIPIEGSEHAITSDEALSLDKLPAGPIVVIGAGYIALEFAGIFTGLGATVHLMFRGDKVLRNFDEECRTQVQENLISKGVNVHTKCTPKEIEKLGEDSYRFTYTDADGADHTIDAGLVMMATGRAARSHGLGLEAAGVKMGKAGVIAVDSFSRTNVPGIWAIGDVTDRIALTPVALMEGACFAKTCFGGVDELPDYESVPSAVFCQPPLSSVGYAEEAAIAHFSGDLDVYVSKFRPLKHTLSGRVEKTLMKLIVHVQTDRVVGVHMVGNDSPEIMQGIAIALKCGATKKIFDQTVGLHPSAAEEFVTMRTATRRVAATGAALPAASKL
ncbi:MAG: hypothetical protein WDW36_002091 [Sanguina aurantia]